jgi:hypothetical protein
MYGGRRDVRKPGFLISSGRFGFSVPEPKSLHQWLAALVVDKCSFNKAIAVS